MVLSYKSVAALALLIGTTTTASAQETRAAGRPTAVRAMTKCASCDSTRVERERLLRRLDSLQREYEATRLSGVERQRAASEVERTLMALRELDTQNVAMSRAYEMSRTTTAVTTRGGPTTIVIQSRPRGYLGVTFDGPNDEIHTKDEHIIRFYGYPRIALVEPGSPADRGGIARGDTLLALNGIDVAAREISLTKMLVPRARMTVRVRRDGDNKDLNVVVGEAPEYYIARAIPLPRVPGSPEAVVPFEPTAPNASTPQPSTRVRAAGVATRSPMAPSVFFMRDGLAGAQMQTITEGLARTVGRKSGVLIVSVRPGPAYESGLEDGDIIIAAEGREVNTVRELQSALVNGNGGEGVKLRVIRAKRARDIILRW